MQKLILVGRLGKDPELYSGDQDRDPVCNFSLAVKSYSEEPTWYQVAVWGNAAEACEQYLKKGSQVGIDSDDIRAEAWIDDDGNPRASLKVNTRRVEFMGGADSDDSNNGNGKKRYEKRSGRNQGKSGKRKSYDRDPMY